MVKKNQIKISREETLERIEKELSEAMNILDDINKRINEALKTESAEKENPIEPQTKTPEPQPNSHSQLSTQ